MDLIFCINTNSFPAANQQSGQTLFDNAIQGVLELADAGQGRCQFYYDSNGESLHTLEIARGFTYEKFVDASEPDLQLFLLEVEDKSPALDALSSDQIEEMAANSYYLPGQAMDAHPDVYALAWVTSGYLLSLATEAKWQGDTIKICKADEQGRFVDDYLLLKNVADQAHGRQHYQQLYAINLDVILSGHQASNEFKAWFAELDNANQKIVADKLKLAVEKGFQGGNPLFDSLSNGSGLREIRCSAFAGGAIRILFKHHTDATYALLNGFIKHSDNEGYARYVPMAERIYNNLC
ncbi:MAG: type II toxin-antitoxin system RelE/ParE family toxin [Marinospirillum sp.]|uniref:type II toxin-antitoxin system RelE/ParE family toxin n=1 Tax=Marinospirillum sp. TaxID=2183934 RepID=UPI0019E9AA84|nr:type II toxin-antitoxin system RelE/ParE family toxin [Marinospirillum sp.]MBE0509077.1 type II toxin-antitoxin system RelE/ParE family toxin [Marinospirillum sp.]